MPESFTKKVINEGTKTVGVETGKLLLPLKVTAALSDMVTGGIVSAILLLGGKYVDMKSGIRKVEVIDPKLGKMIVTAKFRTLPDGRRVSVEILKKEVREPTPYYKFLNEQLKRRKKAEEEMRRRMPREARGMMKRGRYAG